MNLKDIESYNESISKKDIIESNFIDTTKTKFLFLIESNNNLSAEDRKLLIDDLYKIKLSNIDSDSFISGRIPSEVYFQKKVIREFIILTTLSAILCFILLYFLTTNLKFIFFTISSVIISIVISLSLSTVIFFGFRDDNDYISYTILFIVCVSDIMHYTSNQKDYNDKLLFFKDRIDRVGKAIFLTSLTTSFSFLTFLFNDIIPIARFGIITSFGILFTLIVVTIVYAIAIDYNFNKVTPNKSFQKLIDYIINFCISSKKKVFHFSILTLLFLGIYATFNLKIDNYLTDEVNEKSQMLKEVSFFD